MADRTILVVDDEEDVRFPLRPLPGRQGLRRRRGRGPGRGAGECFEKQPLDAASWTSRCPTATALDLLRALKAQDAVAARRPAHRPRHDRPRGAGDQGGRRAVPDQAGRAAGAAGRDRARAREPAHAPGVAGRASRSQARHAVDPFLGESPAIRKLAARGARAWRRRRLPGPDPGRDRHRQGRARALAAPERARAPTRPSSTSTARGSRASCSRASSSATRRAPSPARSRPSRACSRSPTAARCSSTRSATWTSLVQPKLLKVARGPALPPARRRARPPGRRAADRGDPPRPRRAWCASRSSARTSTTGSAPSRWWCRRCASGASDVVLLARRLRGAHRRRDGPPGVRLVGRGRGRPSPRTPGRATSASCATCWSARCC